MDRELNYLSLHRQVDIINNIIANIQQKKILLKSPNSPGFLPDSLDIMIDRIGNKDKAQEVNGLLSNLHSFLSKEYGVWSLPNLETARLIKQEYHAKSNLEIMAGNAYWSKALGQVGIKTTASDSFSWVKGSTTGKVPIFVTENQDALSTVKEHPEVDLIICSWAPNFGEDDLKILDLYHSFDHQPVLLFIGEKNGATNSTSFWQKANCRANMRINCSLQSFDFINERVSEIK